MHGCNLYKHLHRFNLIQNFKRSDLFLDLKHPFLNWEHRHDDGLLFSVARSQQNCFAGFMRKNPIFKNKKLYVYIDLKTGTMIVFEHKLFIYFWDKKNSFPGVLEYNRFLSIYTVCYFLAKFRSGRSPTFSPLLKNISATFENSTSSG